ncbi:hypothetical protein LXL04_014901 [Taraxacum kok-saghyz]
MSSQVSPSMEHAVLNQLASHDCLVLLPVFLLAGDLFTKASSLQVALKKLRVVMRVDTSSKEESVPMR